MKESYLRKVSLFYGLSLLFLFGCATAPVRVEIPNAPVTDEKKASILEENLGSAGYYFMVLNFKLVDDVKTVNRLNRIGARLAHYTERPNIVYKYFIIDSKYRNAFSMPDGYIFFTNSLIKTLGDDEKIAAVMAHEIAHITHKHALQSYERLKGYNPLRSILGEDVFTVATELGYNQAYELQADQTSLRYLYRAGYDPQSAFNVLGDLKKIEEEDEKMFKEDQAQKDKKAEKIERKFLDTHPYSENRIVNVRNYLEQVYKEEKVLYKPEDFNF